MRKVLRGDTIPGLIVFLFGLCVAIYTLVEDTMRVNAQSSDGVPGAGFFPVLLGFLLAGLGAVLTIRGLLQKGSVQHFKLDEEMKQNLIKLLLTAGSIAVFFVLWQLTHLFVPWAAALCFGLNLIFRRSLKFNILYSVIFIAFIYLAFVKGFSIQFNM